MRERIVVIGAGALGISVSYFLSELGFKNIIVFDKGLLAEGSTSKAAGLISLGLWDPLDIRLTKRSLNFFEELERISKGRFSVKRVGLLRISSIKETLEDLLKEKELHIEENVKVEEYHPADIQRMGLKKSKILKALFYPEDSYADPSLYVLSLYEILRKRGVKFRLFEPVIKIDFDGKGVKGVLAKNKVEADIIILATGAWSREILEREGLPLPIKPYRSQAGVLIMPREPKIPGVHELDSGLYFFPEVSKNIVVGDGTEEREVDPSNFSEKSDENFLLNVLGRLTEIYPPSKEGEFLRGWAGLCSATPDRHPLLGKYPDIEGLFILCGMNGFGFMRAPATGEALSYIIAEKKPPVDTTPFLLTRFKNLNIDFDIKQGFKSY